MAVSVPTRKDRGAVVDGLQRPLSLLGEIARRPAGLFGVSVFLSLFVFVAFAEHIAPYEYHELDVTDRLQGPSREHLLGTDDLGRDLLSRLIYGSRVALGVAVPAVAIGLLLGLLIGLIAGFIGGWVDKVMIIVMDTLQAFPWIMLALALIALIGASVTNLIAVLAIAFIPGYARVSRALALSIKQNQFVKAERSLGAGDLRMVRVHVLPNAIAPLFILAAMDLPLAIAAEAGLSFLGLGVQPPTPSWGNILADGFAEVRDSPWGVLWPALVIMGVTLGCTFLGETLRDVVDPKLAGVRRWRRP
jgi:peptide/nickel transport system permease protein